jgi:hypothetical protein
MQNDTPLTTANAAQHPSDPFHGERVFAVVPANRVITITLPPDFPVGQVEVVLISQTPWREATH